MTAKFEELSLIYRLSETLEIDDDIGRGCIALVDQLHRCISAGLVLVDLDGDDDCGFEGLRISSTEGENQYSSEQIDFILHAVRDEPLIDCDTPNRVGVGNDVELADGQRLHLMAVQLERRSHRLGYLIAVRPHDARGFATFESDLIKSTSMLLAVHLMNQRQYLQMQQMFDGMITSLISALDAKDAYTCGHSNRVADLAVELASRLGFDDEQLKQIHMAGMLHDVGKIGVEDRVLQKPGRLTPAEFEQIKQHPVLGYEILSGIRQFREILPAVRHHHESVDGRGYPDGLAGDAIPRDAQILAVADAFDAMTSDRPYRAGMTLDKVIEIFQDGRGRQWAADVVDVLLGSPDVMYQYSLKDQSMVHSGTRCRIDAATIK